MLEDCAHALNGPDPSLEQAGDVAIYSLHKLLPYRVGGFLRVNPSLLGTLQCDFDKLAFDPEALRVFLQTDFGEIRKRRRANYQLYLRLHLPDFVQPLLPNLQDEVVPLNFPISVLRGQREGLYFSLKKRGVTVSSLYHRLFDEVKGSWNQIPALQPSRSILNLPVHEDTNFDDIRLIARTLEECRGELML